MASANQSIDSNNDGSETNKFKKTEERFEQMLQILPREKGWVTKNLLNYHGAWFTPTTLKGVMMAEEHFAAVPNDVFLANFPKAGTTWLKALTFTILNRHRFDFSKHPLLTKNPHELIPFLEIFILQNQHENLVDSSSRVFATHTPYHLLPESIKSSSCPIVYLVRDPKDVFVSGWHQMQTGRPKELPPLPIEEAFEMFCRGIYRSGPYWDHVSGYRKASIDKPGKVLILTYEEMKRDPLGSVKKLAKHLDKPFSEEEEKDGIVEETANLCSFESLSNLEVNKTGFQHFTKNISMANNVFFRKGCVGDWENHLTIEMAQRVDEISKKRFDD